MTAKGSHYGSRFAAQKARTEFFLSGTGFSCPGFSCSPAVTYAILEAGNLSRKEETSDQLSVGGFRQP